MKKVLIISIAGIILIFNSSVHAQTGNTYEVINSLLYRMNNQFPVLDSLYPMQEKSFKRSEWDTLTKEEWKELKTAVRKTKGIKLIADSMHERSLIPALPTLQAFSKSDSLSEKVIEETQPFYMLSTPVFFHNSTKAVIFLALIKGFGTTYLLCKKNNTWTVIKEIYGWM